MTFDPESAMSRAVLARISMFRLMREPTRAQALWDASSRLGPGVVLVRVASLADSHRAALGEAVELQRAMMLLQHDDDESHRAALGLLDSVGARLRAAEPTLSGERRRRALATLASGYSLAGDEATARRITEELLGFVLRADVDSIRAGTARIAPVRAADQLDNHATRLTRLAYLQGLGDTPADLSRALDLLAHASAASAVALEKRQTSHGKLLSRRALAVIEIERAALVTAPEMRRAAVEAAAAAYKEILIESARTPAVSPARMVNRQASYGGALIEVALASWPPDGALAELARCFMAPAMVVHQTAATYNAAPSIRFADACAVTGEIARARRIWTQVKFRLERVAKLRKESNPAIRALERRLLAEDPAAATLRTLALPAGG